MNEHLTLSLVMYGLAIAISMLVAVVIRGIVYTISSTRRDQVTTKVPGHAPGPARRAPAPDVAADIAAIAAAVYAVVGAHRIVHVARADRGFAWTAEGRALHHASHNIARRSGRQSH